jgi:hypothetical protein
MTLGCAMSGSTYDRDVWFRKKDCVTSILRLPQSL